MPSLCGGGREEVGAVDAAAVDAAGECQSREEAGIAVRTFAGNPSDASAGAGARSRDNACTDMTVHMDAQGCSLINKDSMDETFY